MTTPVLATDPIATVSQRHDGRLRHHGKPYDGDGQVVSVQLMDGVIPLPPAPPRVTADVMADAGSSVLSAIQPLAVDETAPMVAIDPLIPVLNAQGATIGFTIGGTTTGVEDGQAVLISVSDGINPPLTYSATVIGNVWSASALPDDAAMLADGSYIVTASVTDVAGNRAIPAIQPVATIDPLIPVLNAEGATIGFTIGGTTTGVEGGQTVSISVSDGINPPLTYSATVIGNVWSASALSGDAAMMADGSYIITAGVTEVAGNPAIPAMQPLGVDERCRSRRSARRR
jgi:hypothetical protein